MNQQNAQSQNQNVVPSSIYSQSERKSMQHNQKPVVDNDDDKITVDDYYPLIDQRIKNQIVNKVRLELRDEVIDEVKAELTQSVTKEVSNKIKNEVYYEVESKFKEQVTNEVT